jgi:hypothetical protein
MTDEQMHALWRKWCNEAAAKAGFTREELDEKLAAGGAELVIRATIKLPEPD